MCTFSNNWTKQGKIDFLLFLKMCLLWVFNFDILVQKILFCNFKMFLNLNERSFNFGQYVRPKKADFKAKILTINSFCYLHVW
jgi:hypothetical protein